MKILFVVDSLYPVTNAAAVRIHSFVNTLPSSEVELFGGVTGEFPADTRGLHPVVRRDVRNGIRFLVSWVSFLIRFHARLVCLIRKAKFDVMVISVPKYELLWSMPLLRHYCSVMTIDVRDSPGFVDYKDHLSQFLPRFLAHPAGRYTSALMSGILSRRLNSADLITVANPAIQAALSNWAPKIRVIANGVDTERFVMPSQRSSSTQLHLVYMGNFAQKDRFDWIYSALPRLDGAVCLNLVGDGREKRKVLLTLRRLGITYRDHGTIDHSAVPQLLEMMQVGFLFRDAYVEESIPVAFFEFASMNIPVICNDVGISGSFVREHGIGFVVESSNQLFEVLSDLVRHPRTLHKFAHLHKKAEREFSRDAQARKLLQELRHAFAERRPARE